MFIDDIINTVNAIANATVSSVETFLFSQRPELLGFKTPPGQTREVDEDGQTLFTEQEEDELRQGVHKLETLMDNAVDTTFDKFEIFLMRNVLVVKESLVGWCRLAHYKVGFPPFYWCYGIGVYGPISCYDDGMRLT